MRRWGVAMMMLAVLVAMAEPLVTIAADWPVRLITNSGVLEFPYSDYSSRDTTYAAGRDWVKVAALGTDNSMYMISTADQGATWDNASVWPSPSWNRDVDYCYDGTYFHFVTSDCTVESDNYSLLYRRAVPQANGTLVWSTPTWQVAIPYEGTYVYNDPKIAVGDDDEPFIVYEQADKDTFLDISTCVTRSDATPGGTWDVNWWDSEVSAVHHFYSACCVAPDIYLVVSLDEDSQLFAWTYSDVGFADLTTLRDSGTEGDIFDVYMWSMVRNGGTVELVYSVEEMVADPESATMEIVARTYDIASSLWGAPATISSWDCMGGASEVDVSVALAGSDVYALWPYEEWVPDDDGYVNTAGQIRYSKMTGGMWSPPAVFLDVLGMGITIDSYDFDTTAGTNASEHIPVVFDGSTDGWLTSDTWFTGLDVTGQTPTPPTSNNFVPAVVAYMVMMLLVNVPMGMAARSGHEVSGTWLGFANLVFVIVAVCVVLLPYL